MTEVPQTQYATFGEDHIAYLVFGGRGVDLLWVPATDSTVAPTGNRAGCHDEPPNHPVREKR